jgi:hypothetical protein
MLDEMGNWAGSVDRMNAEVVPREWADVWKCQRRILVHVTSHGDDSGKRIECITDFDLTASPSGLKVEPEDMRMPSSITVQLPAANPPTFHYDQTLLP